jgi:hypothetical protein
MTLPRPDDLDVIEAAVWRELAAAVSVRGHAWRVGVLATRDGEEADARSVVLREIEVAARELLIYTDARSPKAQQIAAHPLGTLVLWSRELGWQLRLKLGLSMETSGLAVTSRWARLKLTPAAQDYLSPLPPGSTLDHPNRPGAIPQADRDHFAVIAARVLLVDWLELDARGHRRAVFEAGQPARWVSP